MRKTTVFSLVAAACALAGTGAGRAQDATQTPATTTRGSIVLPVGDKVHGHLRGGETHALQVHLAKGDVYSFNVTSQKRGDPLLMHLTVLDPSGNEVNEAARVDHIANGKRVTVGPYVAPATGTYVMEISAQSWFDGDYWGTSSFRGARTTVVRLPSDGTTVGVDVAAGSKIVLKAVRGLAQFRMALPEESANDFAAGDPLVVTMRAGGVASSDTGTYQFGAPGAKSLVAIDVQRPRWKSALVEFPSLPAHAPIGTSLEWINGWRSTLAPAAAGTPPQVGVPVAVGGAASGSSPMFVGAAMSGAFARYSQQYQAVVSTSSTGIVATPVVVNPPAASAPAAPADPASPVTAPPAVAPPAVIVPTFAPTTGQAVPLVPYFDVAYVGLDMFVEQGGGAALTSQDNFDSLRWVPWASGASADVSDAVRSQMLPAHAWTLYNSRFEQSEDPADPFSRTTMDVFAPGSLRIENGRLTGDSIGTFTSTLRGYVDGHQVAAYLATRGACEARWTIAGSGTVGNVPWTLNGTWSIGSKIFDPATLAVQPEMQGTWWSKAFFSGAIVLTGQETYSAGDVVETVTVPEIVGFVAACDMFQTTGTITNTLTSPDGVLTVTRNIPLPDYVAGTQTVQLTTTNFDGAAQNQTLTTGVPFKWRLPVATK